MLGHAIGHESRGPPRWRVIVTRAREYHWTAIIDPGVHSREGEHPLDAMSHWHDSTAMPGNLRCGRKSLLDDNPSSG